MEGWCGLPAVDMTADYLEWLKGLIKDQSPDRLQPFYQSQDWRRLRKEILMLDHHECQICKAKGRIDSANTVHHVKPIEYYPELALSKTYIDEAGVEHRQLISVSHLCHDKEHERDEFARPAPLTPERW